MSQLILPGNTGPGDVRAGKLFSAGLYYNAQGTLVDRTGAAVVLTPGATDIVIPGGIYGGVATDGKVAAVVFNAAKVLDDTTIAGTQGTMPNNTSTGPAGHYLGTQINAGALSGDGINNAYIMPKKGYYDEVNGWAKYPQPDLLSENIKKNKTIFGIAGKSTVVDVSNTTIVDSGHVLSGELFWWHDGNSYPGTMLDHSGGGHVLALQNTSGNFDNDGISVYLQPPAGFYDGQTWVRAYAPDLLESNILLGKNIFGVPGTAIDGSKISSGEALWVSDDAEITYTTQTPKKGKEIQINNLSGSVRVRFDLKTNQTGYSANAQIYVNDVARGTLRTTNSTSYITYTEDVTVNAGDRIGIYYYPQTTGAICYLANYRLYCAFSTAEALILL